MQSAQRTLMSSPSILEQADSDSVTEAESDLYEQHGQDQFVYKLDEDESTDEAPSEDEKLSEDRARSDDEVRSEPDAQRRRITVPSAVPSAFRDLNFEELGKSAALWINGLLDHQVLQFD